MHGAISISSPGATGPAAKTLRAQGDEVMGTKTVETRGNGSVLGKKTVETRGNGSVLGKKTVETRGKGSV